MDGTGNMGWQVVLYCAVSYTEYYNIQCACTVQYMYTVHCAVCGKTIIATHHVLKIKSSQNMIIICYVLVIVISTQIVGKGT